MALVDDLVAALGVVDVAEQIADDLGDRPYTIAVRVEQYDGSIEDGASLVGVAVTDLVLTPRPLVAQATGELASWFGAGTIFSDAGGDAVLTVFTVGPITPKYAVAQLWPAPVDGTSQRTVWWLTGPGLKPGGEPFLLSRPIDSSNPTGWMAVIQRAPLLG